MTGYTVHELADKAPPALPRVAIVAAVRSAVRSPCVKSRRGCAVFDPAAALEASVVRGIGWNGLPRDAACSGSPACRASCGRLCVHAEVRAIRDALTSAASQGAGVRGLDLVHIKVELRDADPAIRGVAEAEAAFRRSLWLDSIAVPSGGPSCWQCSREVLDVGIAGVWLFEAEARDTGHGWLEAPPAWSYYPAERFHALTLAACEIEVPRG